MRSKFNAKRTEVDGIMFASKRESVRYSELKILEKSGEIFSLELQPKFDLLVNGVKVCRYVADFRYVQAAKKNRDGSWVSSQIIVEDSKGVKTPTYVIKKKLLKAIHGIEIVEV